MNISNLNSDSLLGVIRELDLVSAVKFSNTSKYFYEITAQTPLWNKCCKMSFIAIKSLPREDFFESVRKNEPYSLMCFAQLITNKNFVEEPKFNLAKKLLKIILHQSNLTLLKPEAQSILAIIILKSKIDIYSQKKAYEIFNEIQRNHNSSENLRLQSTTMCKIFERNTFELCDYVINKDYQSFKNKIKSNFHEGNYFNIDLPVLNGDALLHVGVNWNKIKIVNHLLKIGANPNCTNRKGETPLHLSADQGRLEITKRLVQAGANIHAQTNNFESPLMRGWYHSEIVAYLSNPSQNLKKSCA